MELDEPIYIYIYIYIFQVLVSYSTGTVGYDIYEMWKTKQKTHTQTYFCEFGQTRQESLQRSAMYADLNEAISRYLQFLF